MDSATWAKRVPADLAHLAERCDAGLIHRGLYVYYLYRGDEIVYVGQTTNVMSRMTAHSVGKSRKNFDGALYRLCESEHEMGRLEAREIDRLKPILNRRGGRWTDPEEGYRMDRHASYILADLVSLSDHRAGQPLGEV